MIATGINFRLATVFMTNTEQLQACTSVKRWEHLTKNTNQYAGDLHTITIYAYLKGYTTDDH